MPDFDTLIAFPGHPGGRSVVVSLGDPSFDVESLLERVGIDVPDRDHALRCATFAGSLFDGLHELLELPPDDRQLAVIAALLHDAGYLRGERDHHRKSYDIINAADLLGLSSTQRTIAACAARYHGRTLPNIEHAGFGELGTEDQRRVRRLSAIVRVAAACDASHMGLVTAVAVRRAGDAVEMVVSAAAEPAVERDRLREAAGGFRALTYHPVKVVVEAGRAASA